MITMHRSTVLARQQRRVAVPTIPTIHVRVGADDTDREASRMQVERLFQQAETQIEVEKRRPIGALIGAGVGVATSFLTHVSWPVGLVVTIGSAIAGGLIAVATAPKPAGSEGS